MTGDAIGAHLGEVLEGLEDQGFEEAEVYVKRGRSRRLERTLHTELSSFHHEQGWAVRAGTARASLFVSGTGEPPLEGPWPEPDGHPVQLPDPVGVPAWQEPSDFEAPLIGEREGLKLLADLAAELDGELAGARLTLAVLEDGSSESALRSLRGIRGEVRHRVAALRVEAVGATGRGGTPVTASLVAAEREARQLKVRSVARRLADLLVVRGAEAPFTRDRGEMLLAPPVGRRLLEALRPLLVGPRAASRIGRLRDRRGRVGGDRLTVIDDGRLPGGLLSAPIDGEGLPTREVVLIEEGMFRQPLLSWWQVREAGHRPSGCSRRASFRDLPLPGPTHLYVRPDPGVAVASLIGALARGFYLLEVTGPGQFDFEEDRFSLPVAGFSVEKGRARAPVGGVVLRGAISTVLRNIHGVGRDLAFAPDGGVIGCPTLLITGLELARHAPGEAALPDPTGETS